ncbi:MAG: 3,4-dihydroxybenzoyl-citryl-spermidine/N-citryl-spermidine--spermidine ligase [Actinomycetota bacterium]|nr:3,4-dihydroxybenzoyl-citryl-spermidine/N-citryl-spermidine--spermidine ligase [Actinomycetota bacterium]
MIEETVEAQRRVLRRLIESLVYEGALRPEAEPGRGVPGEARLAGRDSESGRGSRDRVRLVGRDGDGDPVVYSWAARRRHSFDRVRLGPGTVRRAPLGQPPAEALSPRLFLDEIATLLAASPERRNAFAAELERTVANDAQARRHWRAAGRRASGSTFDDLEALVVDGHPYHPSYKSRLGFDDGDNAAFGPEFGRPIRPMWVGVRRDQVEWAAVSGLRPDVVDDRVVLPVHPWQWRRHGTTTWAEMEASGALVAFGTGEDDYRAQQSIRSLANISRPEEATLKLALSIVNTSTARTLAPHAVANAPLITAWLQGIAARDPYLGRHLRPVLLGERLGVAHSPDLAAIWRESLHSYLAPGEEAAPFTALTHVDATGEPFVAGWVKEQGVEAWTRRLLTVTVAPVLHFLVAHGIALEAHAQNLLLIHAGGRPRRLALRDFHDGVRFCATGLAEPAARPALHPTPPEQLRVNRNSYLEAESDEEVRDFVHDCLFFVNLGELAMFLEDRFELAEERFWALARRMVEDHRRRFPDLAGRAARFDVLAPEVAVEQLTTRRLLPDTEVRLHRVRNPLAGVDAN